MYICISLATKAAAKAKYKAGENCSTLLSARLENFLHLRQAKDEGKWKIFIINSDKVAQQMQMHRAASQKNMANIGGCVYRSQQSLGRSGVKCQGTLH